MAGRLLAIQGQDPRGARLAIRARTRGARRPPTSTGRSPDRSLIITWLNRGTLHLVRERGLPAAAGADDAAALDLVPDAAAPDGGGGGRGRARGGEGGEGARRGGPADSRPAARAARLGRRADRGPGARPRPLLRRLRGDLRARADGRQGARLRGGAGLARADAAGRARSGTRRAGPPLPRRSRPGDRPDLASWAGLPLRDARAGLGAIAAELVDLGDGLVDLARARGARAAPSPAPARRLRSAAARLGLARATSSAPTGLVTTTASSAPSPWSTAAPSPPGASRAGPRWRSSISERGHQEGGRRRSARRPTSPAAVSSPFLGTETRRRLKRRRVSGASGRRSGAAAPSRPGRRRAPAPRRGSATPAGTPTCPARSAGRGPGRASR